MSDQERQGATEFESLTDSGRRAVEAGRLDEAVRCYDAALVWADEHADRTARDRAFCNRATLAIELGDGEAYLNELRRILMRGMKAANGFRAAYAIARSYELKKDRQKAGFYARIAREHAELVGSGEWLAWARNLNGNLLLAGSFFDQAAREYEEALRLQPAVDGVWRALIEENLGYCHVVQGRHPEGFRLLYRALRALRRLGARRYEIYPRLSLCYAHLDVARYGDAERHGRAALAVAAAHADREGRKMALYLLGETAKLAGQSRRARSWFRELQREHYPESRYLPDLLLAIDVRQLVNLKA
jgi:tetratricopeptide (TPR) repeat protein